VTDAMHTVKISTVKVIMHMSSDKLIIKMVNFKSIVGHRCLGCHLGLCC